MQTRDILRSKGRKAALRLIYLKDSFISSRVNFLDWKNCWKSNAISYPFIER